MTEREELRTAFGVYLWAATMVEGNGVLVADRLARSPWLTAEERAFAGDVIRLEEVGHQRRMRRMAEALTAGPRPDIPPATRGLADRDDLELLAAMNHSEALFLRCFGNVTRVFAAFAPKGMQAEMDAIRAEEVGHQAWGATVLRRLKDAGVPLPRARVKRDSIPEMVGVFRQLLAAAR